MTKPTTPLRQDMANRSARGPRVRVRSIPQKGPLLPRERKNRSEFDYFGSVPISDLSVCSNVDKEMRYSITSFRAGVQGNLASQAPRYVGAVAPESLHP
jgi:hypothetical protein